MLIGNNWKIETDTENVILLRRSVAKTGKNAGQEKWTPAFYLATLQNALKCLVDIEVKETHLTDLRIVIKKQEELYKLIKGVTNDTV